MSQKKHKILNLGAGIQSSAIYGLMVDGEIETADYAVFADTQGEPQWVYEQVDQLEQLGGPPIIRVTAGNLSEDLKHGRNSTGQRFASIPAHTTYQPRVKGGKIRRQCTREYKIEPIETWIRRELLGLRPKQHIPKDVHITSLFGFSTDESNRAVKMQLLFAGRARWDCAFPLMDEEILMSRQDCQNYIEDRFGVVWRSSRCTFCPLQQNPHFAEIKEHDQAGWELATKTDESLRTTGSIANRDKNEIMYVHRACTPLAEANLDKDQTTLFDEGECENGCFT